MAGSGNTGIDAVGESESQVAKARKSKVRKAIQRTLNTARYESVVITCEFEEEIEWTTLDERSRKVTNWETLLIDDFKRAQDRILAELGLEHKRGYVRDNLSEREASAASTDDKMLDLDRLDAVEIRR